MRLNKHDRKMLRRRQAAVAMQLAYKTAFANLILADKARVNYVGGIDGLQLSVTFIGAILPKEFGQPYKDKVFYLTLIRPETHMKVIQEIVRFSKDLPPRER